MKISYTYYLFFPLLFCLLIISESCNISDQVASSKFIQKRKYNKGYYINNLFNKKQTYIKKEDSLTKESYSINEETEENPLTFLSSNGDSHQQTANINVLYTMTNDYILSDLKHIINFPNSTTNSTKYLFNRNEKIINIPFSKNDTIIDNKKIYKKPVNRMALTGFLSSLLGFVSLYCSFFLFNLELYVLCAILAIIFSSIGLKRIKQHPDLWRGNGIATAGFVIGIIELTLLLVALVLLIFMM